MIVTESHAFCSRCNAGRMQGQDRGYASFVGVADVEGAVRDLGWRRRWGNDKGTRRPLLRPECVAEDRAAIAAAVPLPLFDGDNQPSHP